MILETKLSAFYADQMRNETTAFKFLNRLKHHTNVFIAVYCIVYSGYSMAHFD